MKVDISTETVVQQLEDIFLSFPPIKHGIMPGPEIIRAMKSTGCLNIRKLLEDSLLFLITNRRQQHLKFTVKTIDDNRVYIGQVDEHGVPNGIGRDI